jgi:hypothetical protein
MESIRGWSEITGGNTGFLAFQFEDFETSTIAFNSRDVVGYTIYTEQE